MNAYLMSQLLEAKHLDLVHDAHTSRQVRAARTGARTPRRSRRA